MNKYPIISVVIPVYNVEDYLSICIDSILNQTYKNLDIIIVDDGATDSCPQICDNYATVDGRVKVIHQNNAGLSAARNSGIDIAVGQYITFVDSDDVIAEDMIEYLYRLLTDYNVDMSLCQFSFIDEKGNHASHDKPVKDVVIGDNSEKCLESLMTDQRLDTVAWSKLYKTSMFNDVRYPVGKYHEDAFTTYKIVSKCNRIAVGGERKYFYRVRSQSITSSGFSLKHLDSIDGKLEFNSFIEDNYPQLGCYTHGEIIYACNVCVKRMANSNFYDLKINEKIQSLYRTYESDYLKQRNHGIKGKLFSLCAYLNLSLFLKFLSFFRVNR